MQRGVARMLRQRGSSYVEVAESLRRQFALNPRTAFRVAHDWSQHKAAEEWSRLWPEEPKSSKNISYWELWPGKTGHAPSLSVVEKLAELYQCSVADLLSDRGNYRHLDTTQVRPGENDGWTTTVSAREAPHGWFIKTLVTVLDVGSATALEERTIVAAQDGLDEIATTMSIPRHPKDNSELHAAEVRILSGGRLERRDQPHESQFRHVIALARPLAVGEEHLFRLAIEVPPDQLMIGHAVHVPLQRSDYFDLTVRFSPERLPISVWLMNGVPPAVLRDRDPKGRQVSPDRFGELKVSFDNLLQGQAYGLRWVDP